MNTDVVVFALFVSLLWGFSPIIHKIMINKYSPASIMLLTATVNFICVLFYFFIHYKKVNSDYASSTNHDILLLGFTTCFTIFLANIIYYTILKNHESYIVSALVYSSPMFTLLLAYFLLKENVNYYGFFGVCSIVFGVMLIAMNEENLKFITPK